MEIPSCQALDTDTPLGTYKTIFLALLGKVIVACPPLPQLLKTLRLDPLTFVVLFGAVTVPAPPVVGLGVFVGGGVGVFVLPAAFVGTGVFVGACVGTGVGVDVGTGVFVGTFGL